MMIYLKRSIRLPNPQVSQVEMFVRERGNIRKLTGLVFLLIVLSSAVLFQQGCSGDAAIVVNGTAISAEEYNREVDRRISVIQENNPEELEGEKGKKLLGQTERQVATEMIKAELMAQEARKMGVEVPVEQIDSLITCEKDQKGPEEFAGELERQGLTEQEYREKVEEQALVEALGLKVCQDITVTRDEAESFYLTHKDLFSHTPMIHVRHILLDTEGQAKMVATEAREGGDFARLAGMYSRDDMTRSNGGDLGWVEQGTMDPEFENAAFALESGEVSGVVEASDGYHVIKVLEKRDAYTPPFEEVEKEALIALESRRKEEAFSDWLRTVYANASVRVPPGLGVWDPALGMVVED